MATIIEFPNTVLGELASVEAGSVEGGGGKHAKSGLSAEIIIFPGVRIERRDGEPQSRRMQSAMAGVRRDQMELLDC